MEPVREQQESCQVHPRQEDEVAVPFPVSRPSTHQTVCSQGPVRAGIPFSFNTLGGRALFFFWLRAFDP